MTVVQIEPTKDHPVPYDLTEEKPATLLEEMAVAGNTAELQESLGATLDVSEGDMEKEKELLRAVAEAKKPTNLTNQTTAFAAAAFLRTYGAQLAMDAVQARSAITNKLMEIADCGDPRYELKALELLGKHSDIGIFTERSEITINYKSPEELEKAIKDRVKNLLNATVVDVTPLGGGTSEEDLDLALGVLSDD
jgi:DNA polymerase III delta prime subunit